MFTQDEKIVIEALLQKPKIDEHSWELARKNNKPISIINLEDFIKLEIDFRLSQNGEINTDLTIQELSEVFNLNPNKIEQASWLGHSEEIIPLYQNCKEHEILKKHSIYFAEWIFNNDFFNKYTKGMEKLLKEEQYQKMFTLGNYLKMNTLKAKIIHTNFNLPLAYNGALNPLYKKILAENRSLIINTATPFENPCEEEGVIYVVNGINKQKKEN